MGNKNGIRIVIWSLAVIYLLHTAYNIFGFINHAKGNERLLFIAACVVFVAFSIYMIYRIIRLIIDETKNK